MTKRSQSSGLSGAALEFFRKQGAKGGRIGGGVSWKGLTPEQRSARARKASLAAAKARQAKAKKTR
jgi:hypothetical protein